LQAKDVLLEALRKFTGTIVFVSHDRYFIDKLATRIFHIENGTLQDYPGNYEDYLWQKEKGAIPMADSSVKPKSCESDGSGRREEQEKRAKKSNPMAIRRMEKQRDELEEQISRCEAEITSLE